MSNSAKIVPTAIEFIDIAGLVKGAAEGEGLGNKFLANIREVDAIAQVVRIFEDSNITHVHNAIDPVNDIEVINTELIMADLGTIERRIKDARGNDPVKVIERSVLAKLKDNLDRGALAIKLSFNEKEVEIVRELHLLTNKKFIYVFNASEKQVRDKWRPGEELLNAIAGSEYVILSTTFELLLSDASQEEQKELLDDLGLNEGGLDVLIKEGYRTLGLLTFLTTGEDETRAWTAHVGDPIPRAARAIHTDFEQKFIRADVINWKELLDIKSWSEAKKLGKIRTVGRDYIIQEGDVVEIKI